MICVGNVFSDFYFNETHKLKIFGTLVYYDNQLKKSIENFSVNDIANKIRENNIAISINNAIKSEIVDRIRFYCKMFSTNKYFILECCDDLIMAFKTAVWEKDKNDVRLDDGKQDIDSLDAQEYSTEPYQDVLIQIN